ncbi:MAG: hypothetical protein DRH56_04725 [Deltaproteobacteria bacterium]|nr:MAG: hypothetical protein DRH56_04725 [Deltaproteobacteria bacterium]
MKKYSIRRWRTRVVFPALGAFNVFDDTPLLAAGSFIAARFQAGDPGNAEKRSRCEKILAIHGKDTVREPLKIRR